MLLWCLAGREAGDGRPEKGAAVAEVRAEMVANVWKVIAAEGQQIGAGETLVILESMKMEMEVRNQSAGVVRDVLCQTGKTVQAGQRLLLIEEEN